MEKFTLAVVLSPQLNSVQFSFHFTLFGLVRMLTNVHPFEHTRCEFSKSNRAVLPQKRTIKNLRFHVLCSNKMKR